MIHDKIENLHRYKKLFQEIAEYIKEVNLSSLTNGKHVISETLFVLVNEYETHSNDIEILENHRKYIDFQIVLSGFEKIALADSFTNVQKEYDNDSDYELVKAKPYLMDFKEGFFFALYPNEYHHPGITENSPQKVKKIVFKQKFK